LSLIDYNTLLLVKLFNVRQPVQLLIKQKTEKMCPINPFEIPGNGNPGNPNWPVCSREKSLMLSWTVIFQFFGDRGKLSAPFEN
jgi:hypothetical protein